MPNKIELYDCTLREGEQAAGASFSLANRIELFRLLDEFGFDYVELGWPVVYSEILESFEECRKIRKRAKIVAFGSTSINSDVEKDENLNSLVKSQADYACIFGKTWLEHVSKQLKLTPEENLDRIKNSIRFLKKNKMKVFYDAEHYFDGFKNNGEYALETIIAAASSGAERIILCDTNGGILPDEARKIVTETRQKLLERGVNVELGVHFHNDCNLALANTLACLENLVLIQGTINGIGERIGNLNFSDFIPVYIDKLGGKLEVNLRELKNLNERAFRLSGLEVPEIRPFVGDSAFAHKGGVHIDAENKGASYQHVVPERYGNKSVVVLNSLGGKACVVKVAERFGYSLDKKNPEVQRKIEELILELRELEQKGYCSGTLEAEQYLLIEKYFGNLRDFFRIIRWGVKTRKNAGKEESEFFARIDMDKEEIEKTMKIEGGPIDAAYKTLVEVFEKEYPLIRELKIGDFHVGIARRHAEESTVRTQISFENQERFETVGVDGNIIQSGLEALEKGFRYYLNKLYKRAGGK